ncbi:MAG: pilus (MSHA type) biogenesis protein MshL [Proteobacteria bacterium]|nr:pilus (MSHA type) biogenesis protein MshL [Pseudomonadota bacterium]NOG60205.1 pilus (MSHA type) biogenesis protein MshL [Pseudomonadota bacterium]
MRKIRSQVKSGIFLVLFILTGCQDQTVRQDVVDSVEDVVNESVSNNANQDSLPDSVANSLIPTINLDTANVPEIKDEERFDISVNAVAADQFFLSLVDGTDYNMVIHPEVSGSVTLNLRNVTIPEVLEAARDVYGFEFISTQYGFQVLPGRLRARIYQINYLNIERTGSSQTSVSSGSLTASNTVNEDGTSTSTGGAAGTEIRTEQALTSFWTELQESVTAIVGAGDGRSVVVNPQSGVVVVRALPNELREVEAYLQATQLIVQRQVILEAKFIEVSLNEKYQSGINWSSLLTPGNNSFTASNIGGGTVLVNEGGVSGISGNTGNLDPENFSAISGAAATAFGGVFSLAVNLGDFNAFIELLKTQGNVQVLSSPRVATMNNQKAVIKVGSDEYFVTDISTNNVTTTTTTTIQPDIELTPFFSGIALDVTPQISQEDDVTLHVHPSISEVVDQQKTVTVGNVTQQLPLALSTVRESDSIVRARSGQVIVIGGLMQETTNDQDAKTPFLGDLPGIGSLFNHKKQESVKSELVILLKPVVVKSSDEWNDELLKTRGNVKGLRDVMNQPPPESFLDDLFAKEGT